MKMKKFEASSMKEALEKIKEELGPDAFILGTKQITKKGPLGFGDRKFLQVTAAIEEEDIKPRAASKPPPKASGGIDIEQGSETGFASSARSNESASSGIPTYTPTGKAAVAEPPPRPSFSEGFETVFAAARAESHKKSRDSDIGSGRPLRKELDELKEMVAGLGEREPDLSPLQRELGELKGLLYNVVKSQTPIFGKSMTPTLLSHYQRLKDTGIDEAVAAKLVQTTSSKLDPKHHDNDKKVFAYLRAMIRKSIDVAGSEKVLKIQALVGPTGVGKTTTLAKMAANATLSGKAVALITLDTYRIASVEQLKRFAKIMDLPIQVALNLNELRGAIQFHEDKDLILIDTPGYSQKDEAGMQMLQDFLLNQKDINVHLVLSATTKTVDLNDIVSKFESLSPGYLIFTKLDETSAYGPLFNQIIKTRKPVSFITTGQNVPEDLEPASDERLADLFSGKNFELVKGGSQ